MTFLEVFVIVSAICEAWHFIKEPLIQLVRQVGGV